MTERDAMRRALVLAERGWGRVAPNPMVGAVLLRDGAVIAEGAHLEFGGPHAEAAALEMAGDARGATCVVTLEPCAHTGKTPSCADALIAAGVRRVVAAMPDPHPAARGGADRLRGAGVEVTFGVEAEAAAALNAGFLWSLARKDRPFVALKLAASMDGFIADASGHARWVSDTEARAYVQWLRAGYDAVAVGRRTALADDPELTVRGAVVPRQPPVRVVFARSGGLETHLQLVASAREVPTMLVTAVADRDAAAAELAPRGVQVIGADTLSEALRALRAADIRTVLVEGGGRLAAALLAADLVDRVYLIQAPLWLGDGVPAFPGRDPATLGEAIRWTAVERRALGPDTLLVLDRALCLPAS